MARAITKAALMVAKDPGSSSISQPIDEPLQFKSILRPQVWGGSLLVEQFGKAGETSIPIGESWEISGLPENASVVANGTFAGRTLAELWQQDVAGERKQTPTFPLFVKWLDCRGELSVQVHPNDKIAGEMLGHASGKSEAWIVVHAEPTARVYAGVKEGVTEQELVSRLDSGTVAECLHSFIPQVGDCISLPAGTIHSAGGGVVFAEVQQPSDVTFRLFDWNRLGLDGQPRQLHREMALKSITWPQGPVWPCVPRQIMSAPGCRCESLLRTADFDLERYTLQSTISLPRQGEMTIWMVLGGAAILDQPGQGSQLRLERGSTILMPPGVRNTKWSAAEAGKSCQLLCVRLPQVPQED
ncbi:MAG: yvyI [Schlesneria sp.]|nr:yvyI [Schlesneria sp.]